MSAQDNEPKSVVEHLGELRNKIFISLGFFIGGSIFAHMFHEKIIAFLLQPLGQQHLIFLSPLEPLFFILKIDCITGFIISFPVILYCIFSYITPALSKKTRSIVLFFSITSTFLLFISLYYSFFITIPISIKFLSSIAVAGIENNFSVKNYISFFITQTLIIMAVFQIPIIVIGGTFLKAFKTKFLSEKRRYIYLILTIALAILTPTMDIFSLGIVLIPCLVIFEVSLIGGKIVEYLRKKS